MRVQFCTAPERGSMATGSVAPDGQIIVNGVGYKAPSLAAAISLGATRCRWLWPDGKMWRVGSVEGPTLGPAAR